MRNKIRHVVPLLFFALSLAIFTACSSPTDDGETKTRVEDNGLSRDINDIVPDSLLRIMDSLGMPINGGDSPPAIGGYYHAAPFILLSSNRAGDSPGAQFADYYVRFYDQSNSQLTVNIDYQNASEFGNGLGSFIVGKADSFSVFSRLTVTVGTDSAYILVVFSGKVQQQAIASMHVALFMLDNLGNPSGYFIANGDGRIFHDSDGTSEKIEGFPKRSSFEHKLRPTATSAIKP